MISDVMKKAVKFIKYSLFVVIPAGVIFAIAGWTGIIVCSVILIALVVYFSIMVYGLGYTDKKIGKGIKSFLGYDFGKKYEVLVNETRVHGDWPVHFLIKIPQEAMKGVEEFCRTKSPSKCTAECCEKYKEYKTGDYVERREHMKINFKDCTIEFSGVSY